MTMLTPPDTSMLKSLSSSSNEAVAVVSRFLSEAVGPVHKAVIAGVRPYPARASSINPNPSSFALWSLTEASVYVAGPHLPPLPALSVRAAVSGAISRYLTEHISVRRLSGTNTRDLRGWTYGDDYDPTRAVSQLRALIESLSQVLSDLADRMGPRTLDDLHEVLSWAIGLRKSVSVLRGRALASVAAGTAEEFHASIGLPAKLSSVLGPYLYPSFQKVRAVHMSGREGIRIGDSLYVPDLSGSRDPIEMVQAVHWAQSEMDRTVLYMGRAGDDGLPGGVRRFADGLAPLYDGLAGMVHTVGRLRARLDVKSRELWEF